MYYVVPVLAAALMFAALKLKPAYKINLVLAGFAVIFSVYAIELYLQITYSSLLGSGARVMGALQPQATSS